MGKNCKSVSSCSCSVGDLGDASCARDCLGMPCTVQQPTADLHCTGSRALGTACLCSQGSCTRGTDRCIPCCVRSITLGTFATTYHGCLAIAGTIGTAGPPTSKECFAEGSDVPMGARRLGYRICSAVPSKGSARGAEEGTLGAAQPAQQPQLALRWHVNTAQRLSGALSLHGAPWRSHSLAVNFCNRQTP